MTCKKGEIYRVGYIRTSKKGSKVYVKGNCIRATSQSGLKRSSIDSKINRTKKVQKHIARQLFGAPRCGPGEILKDGYKRSSYTKKSGTTVPSTWVGPTCVKSATGSSKKGTKLFNLARDDLKPFGYEDVANKTVEQRHRALNRALKEYDALPLMRKLNALRVVNKNRNPSLSKKFENDANYIKTTKKYASRPTASKSKKRSKRRTKN